MATCIHCEYFKINSSILDTRLVSQVSPNDSNEICELEVDLLESYSIPSLPVTVSTSTLAAVTLCSASWLRGWWKPTGEQTRIRALFDATAIISVHRLKQMARDSFVRTILVMWCGALCSGSTSATTTINATRELLSLSLILSFLELLLLRVTTKWTGRGNFAFRLFSRVALILTSLTRAPFIVMALFTVLSFTNSLAVTSNASFCHSKNA